MQALRKYFNIFMFFQAFLLASFVRPVDDVRLLILNEENSKSTCTSTYVQTGPAKQLIYQSDKGWTYRTPATGAPNRPMSDEEAELIFGTGYKPKKQVPVPVPEKEKSNVAKIEASTKEEDIYMEFTHEQLLQLAEFPEESVKYAHKMYTKDMAAGKQISSAFGYFLTICKNHAKRPKQEPRQWGKSKASVQSAPPVEVWDEEGAVQRMRDRAIRIKERAISMGFDIHGKTQQQLINLIRGYDPLCRTALTVTPQPTDIPKIPTPPFEGIDFNSLVVKEAEATVVYTMPEHTTTYEMEPVSRHDKNPTEPDKHNDMEPVSDNSWPSAEPIVSEPVMLGHYEAYSYSSPCGFDGDYEEVMD